MKIKTLLQTSIVICLGLTLATGMLVLLSFHQANNKCAEHDSSSDLARSVAELRLVAFDFFLYGGERAKKQWESKYESIKEILPTLNFVGGDEQRIFHEIRKEFDDLAKIFDELAANGRDGLEKEGMHAAQLWSVKESRLGQFLVKSQSMVIGAFRLDSMSHEEMRRAERKAAWLAASFGGLLLVLITGMSLLIHRKVIRPTARLHEGVRVIATGNLDHRVGISARDELGELSRAFDTMTSSLRAMTEDLRESEEKYRSIVDNVGIGITIISPNMEILAMNSQMRQWFPHIDTGMNPICYQAFNNPPREDVCSYCPTRKTLHDGKVYESTTETPAGDKVKNFRIISTPIKDLDGMAKAAIEIVEDITKQKLAEKELENYRYQLETMVEQRTQELKEVNDLLRVEIAERKRVADELRQTILDLERSNADLQQFAYVSSHDLQEPLRMVSSYVQLLARRYKGMLDSDAEEFIAFAVEGATRMQLLINDLLAYSRVGTRGGAFRLTDFGEALSQALLSLSASISESGATVTYDPLPHVMADMPQVIQLFEQMVDNAIKFRSQASPAIHISSHLNEGTWTFSIRDNGIGIDPKFSERIFIIFQRLHGRGEYTGTGIGLAICKRIVERHGGRIWVESEHGKGSTFYFTGFEAIPR